MTWRFPAALAFLVSQLPGLSAADGDAGSPPRKVIAGFNLTSVTEIADAAQTFTAICYVHRRWHDPALATGARQVFLEDAAVEKANDTWRPYINFINETTAATPRHAVLTIGADGTVEFGQEFEVTLRAEFELRSFPFDSQVLQFKIESFAFPAKEMIFEPDPTKMKLGKIRLAQWDVSNLRWKTSLERDEMERDEYHRLTLSVDAVRKPGFYVWQAFVPLFILFLIASTVFFLPVEDLSDRIGVITTSLLTAVALSYTVRMDLPKISYLTTIDRLFVTTYVFLGAKILGMLIVRQISEGNPAFARKIDRLSRWTFPGAYLATNATIVLLSITRG